MYFLYFFCFRSCEMRRTNKSPFPFWLSKYTPERRAPRMHQFFRGKRPRGALGL